MTPFKPTGELLGMLINQLQLLSSTRACDLPVGVAIREVCAVACQPPAQRLGRQQRDACCRLPKRMPPSQHRRSAHRDDTMVDHTRLRTLHWGIRRVAEVAILRRFGSHDGTHDEVRKAIRIQTLDDEPRMSGGIHNPFGVGTSYMVG